MSVYPARTPTPIQYHFFSGKKSCNFRIITPSDSVELGSVCNTMTQKYVSLFIWLKAILCFAEG